jgi:outer membrane lipoprotein-sorting protein
VAITAVDHTADGFTIVARDGRGKTAGRLALDFAESPLRLTGWTVIDARGHASEGAVYLKRPGRARFEYDPPSGLVVVSDGRSVSIADNRLMTFQRQPLATTPLALLLATTVQLDRSVDVTDVERTADGFVIVARDPSGKNAGQLALSFADTPLQLTGWTITDARGGATRVRLKNLQETSGLDRHLFVAKDPRPPSAHRRS